MALEIERLPRAQADQLDIWLYVAAESVKAADNLSDRLDEAAGFLATHPEAGRSRAEFAATLRSHPIGAYVIFYRHDSKTLTIVRILSSYRDITGDLFQ